MSSVSSLSAVILQMKRQLQYYVNLFTSQYKLSPNLNAWQTALMTPVDDLTTCIEQFNVAYDLDNAVGNQLDVLGELIGVSRIVPFQPSGGVSPVLDDSTYRLLLYATLAENSWDGTIVSLYKIWQTLFPAGYLSIHDNQNMTANIITTGTFTSIEMDLINHGLIVPRPEGVQYNSSGAGLGPYFGFDLNNTVIAGFNIGKFT